MNSPAISKPTVSMALAMDRNKLIGNEGDMPWHIPGEQAHFKAITMGKPIIMGRVTFDSIGKPLPGRANYVVTRNPTWQADGVQACLSLAQAIGLAAEKHEEVVVIGGAALCREAMPITQRVYLTSIDYAYEGDTWFDSFQWSDWQEVQREDKVHEGVSYAYLILERKL